MASGTGDGFRKCIRLAMILANLLILVSTVSQGLLHLKHLLVLAINVISFVEFQSWWGPKKQDFGKKSK